MTRSIEPRRVFQGARRRIADLVNDEAQLARLGQRLGAAALILLIVFVAFYTYDRYMVRVESPMDQAVRALEEAIRKTPNDAEARARVADAYARQGRYDQAVGQYKEALKLKENWQPVLLALAAAERARKNDREAEAIFQQIADMHKDDEGRFADENMGVVYFRLAEYGIKAGRYDEAAERAKEALRVDRTDADSLFMLATAEEKRGNLAEAREAFRKASAFDPNFREAFAGLHRAATDMGDSREAGYARGMELLATADLDGALAGFRRLVQEAPDYAEAHQGLGLALAKKGQREEAITEFKAALERNPTLLLAQWSLGSLEKAR